MRAAVLAVALLAACGGDDTTVYEQPVLLVIERPAVVEKPVPDDIVHKRESCWAWGEKHYACAIAEVAALRADNRKLRETCDRLRNALARTHYDLRATDALITADLKTCPPEHSQD